MNIRTDRYAILDSAVNRQYWSQDLYPQWAALSFLPNNPGQRAGAGVEPNYHDADEVWLFLSGRGGVWLDGQSFAITPNTLVYTPMGVIHRFPMFTDFENCNAVTRLERKKRSIHIYPEAHGQPQPTVPGFVIPGADNTGPLADRGPRCPISELRAVNLAAGERVAKAPAAQTEYWLVLNGAVQLSVEGLDVELGPSSWLCCAPGWCDGCAPRRADARLWSASERRRTRPAIGAVDQPKSGPRRLMSQPRHPDARRATKTVNSITRRAGLFVAIGIGDAPNILMELQTRARIA